MLRSEQIPLGGYRALDDKEYTPESRGEIRIPLPEKYSAKAISGDSGIIDTLTRMFCLVDTLVTSVRVSEVFEGYATGKSGVGTIHSKLSSNQAYFGLYCVGLALFALYDEYLYRVEQGRKDKEIDQNI